MRGAVARQMQKTRERQQDKSRGQERCLCGGLRFGAARIERGRCGQPNTVHLAQRPHFDERISGPMGASGPTGCGEYRVSKGNKMTHRARRPRLLGIKDVLVYILAFACMILAFGAWFVVMISQ